MLIKRGSPTVAMPGYEIKILDLQGNEVKRNNLGAICIKLPYLHLVCQPYGMQMRGILALI